MLIDELEIRGFTRQPLDSERLFLLYWQALQVRKGIITHRAQRYREELLEWLLSRTWALF